MRNKTSINEKDSSRRRGNVKVAQATIAAQEANIRRSTDLKAFARIVAPFKGTSRCGPSSAEPSLLQKHEPALQDRRDRSGAHSLGRSQDVAPSVRDGADAAVTVREFAGQKFPGKVARFTGALDPATRTMGTEVRVPNPDANLLSGMYVEVALTLASPHKVLEVPATVLYNDAKGLRVAVVGSDDVVHLVPVTIERDTGATLQISRYPE